MGPGSRARYCTSCATLLVARSAGTTAVDAATSAYGAIGSALQPLVALAVVAAALLDPLQAAVTVIGLVGIVLIEAGVQPRLAGALAGVFGRDSRRERRATGRSEPGGGRRAPSRRVTGA